MFMATTTVPGSEGGGGGAHLNSNREVPLKRGTFFKLSGIS